MAETTNGAKTWDSWSEQQAAKLADTGRPAGWEAALDRIVDDARAAADANWRELALASAAATDQLSALVVGLLADGIEDPLRSRLVEATKRANEAALAIRRGDA